MAATPKAPPPLGEYDPGQVIFDFNGILIHGYASGSMIKAAQDEARWFKKIGGDGEGIRVKNRNNAGKVTFHLQQQSGANDLLMAMYVLDRRDGSGKGPVAIKDFSGHSLVAAEVAWIEKCPDLEFAKEASDREWVLDSASLDIFVGGN